MYATERQFNLIFAKTWISTQWILLDAVKNPVREKVPKLRLVH